MSSKLPPIDFSVIDHKWTPNQLSFVKHWAKTGSLRQSYLHAYGMQTDNMNLIQRAANKLTKKPYIIQAMALINERARLLLCMDFEEMVIDRAWVLKRAALLADFNLRKFIKTDEQGNAVYDFRDATEEDWYCIGEYTVEEIAKGKGDDVYFVDKIKIKPYDKLRALELVGRHVDVQAFKDNFDHRSGDGSMSPKATTIDPKNLSTAALLEISQQLETQATDANKPNE